MQTNATHNGTCQVCGRAQAHKARGLAKHGYKVTDWGFSGTCRGSDRDPVEVSTDLLDATCADLTARAEPLAQATPESVRCVVLTHTEYKEVRRYVTERTQVQTVVKTEAEYDAWKAARGPRYGGGTWRQELTNEAYRLRGVAASMRAHVEFLRELKAERHGQPLLPRMSRSGTNPSPEPTSPA